MLVKRGLLLFWALWLSAVCATNVGDGLKALGLLPPGWTLASGNYALVAKTTSIHGAPAWLVVLLFAGVVIWEGVAAGLFWRAALRFPALTARQLDMTFAVSLALCAAFVLADELFIAYAIEAVHLRIFAGQLLSLLALSLLPPRE